MKKTVVINVVGLTSSIIKDMPFLSTWSKNKVNNIYPVLPALTCSSQSTYLTGELPSKHGIVGNGWYERNESEIKFWKQSNKLVEAASLWDEAKKRNPNFTSANMFWWFNMYSNADYGVTPRPQYRADGQKIPDCYSNPPELRDTLQKKLGTFPLFHFWGPRTTIKSSKWIADASIEVDKEHNPTLSVVYLPHLDYILQKVGPNSPLAKKDYEEIDGVVKTLINHFESRGAEIIILSEYGITEVNNPIHINRVLREKGLLSVRIENGKELLDPGTSEAFAVSDHQIAHVYVKNPLRINEVKEILRNVPGIEKVLGEEGKIEVGLNHSRSGDLVVVADKNSWFTYYYWLNDDNAPDFARLVEIHRKPGYDPVELFINPKIKFPTIYAGLKLLKKKLGFRTLFDVIPLDAKLVKGSHGRIPESKEDYPVFISSKNKQNMVEPTEVKRIILETIFG